MKVGDQVRPTKELWKRFLEFEKKSGPTDPPIHTVYQICEDGIICGTHGYNYHLIAKDNLEIVEE